MTPPTTRRQALRASFSTAVAVAGLSGVTGSASAQSTLTFDSTDLDGAVAETGVVHESITNTDHTDSSVLKQGYRIASPYLGTDLVGYWPLQEDSGTTAYDFSGNGNDSTNTGVSVGATGLLGTSSYDYDGVDDYTEDESSYSVANDADFTICFWANVNAGDESGSQHAISLNNENAGGIPYTIVYYADTAGTSTPNVRVNHRDNDGNQEVFSTGSDLADGNWHYVAVTFEGESSRSVYIDGSLSGSDGNTVNGEMHSQVEIGGSDDFGQYLNGRLSDVRIYNRSLSQSEIQTLYDVVDTQGELVTQARVS